MSFNRTIFPDGGVLPSNTLTADFIIERRNCGDDCLADPCCGWNYAKCNADNTYRIPVCIVDPASEPVPGCDPVCETTDTLYFIFAQPDELNTWGSEEPATFCWTSDEIGATWLASVSVFDVDAGCLNEISYVPPGEGCDPLVFADYSPFHYVGGDLGNRRTYQGIQIKPTINFPCRFRFKFSFKRADGSTFDCYSVNEYEKLECAPSVLIEGHYPPTGKASFDCNDKFYGAPPYSCGQTFYYRNLMRFRGELLQTSTDITRQEVEGWRNRDQHTVTTQMVKKYKLRISEKLPPPIIKQLETILAAPRITIGDLEVKFSGTITNESVDDGDGIAWFTAVELSGNPCLIENDCT